MLKYKLILLSMYCIKVVGMTEETSTVHTDASLISVDYAIHLGFDVATAEAMHYLSVDLQAMKAAGSDQTQEECRIALYDRIYLRRTFIRRSIEHRALSVFQQYVVDLLYDANDPFIENTSPHRHAIASSGAQQDLAPSTLSVAGASIGHQSIHNSHQQNSSLSTEKDPHKLRRTKAFFRLQSRRTSVETNTSLEAECPTDGQQTATNDYGELLEKMTAQTSEELTLNAANSNASQTTNTTHRSARHHRRQKTSKIGPVSPSMLLIAAAQKRYS